MAFILVSSEKERGTLRITDSDKNCQLSVFKKLLMINIYCRVTKVVADHGFEFSGV